MKGKRPIKAWDEKTYKPIIVLIPERILTFTQTEINPSSLQTILDPKLKSINITQTNSGGRVILNTEDVGIKEEKKKHLPYFYICSDR